jgi:hypothetical protein
MATTIEELSDHDKMALFQHMIQAGAIAGGVLTGSMGDAMSAVEMAGTVTLDDLKEAHIDVAAAAHQLIQWSFQAAGEDRVPRPSWLPI